MPMVTPLPTTTCVLINFEAETSSTPSGYFPDYGLTYRNQSGYTYGWDNDLVGDGRERGVDSDQVRDTLVIFDKHDTYGGATWTMRNPFSGNTSFTVGFGDPQHGASNADGATVNGISGVCSGTYSAGDYCDYSIHDDAESLSIFGRYATSGDLNIQYVSICGPPEPTAVPTLAPSMYCSIEVWSAGNYYGDYAYIYVNDIFTDSEPGAYDSGRGINFFEISPVNCT